MSESTHLDIVIQRTFKAPRQLVWDVWTQAEHIAKWWGPKGMTTKVLVHDFVPGGKWHYVMQSPDGKEFPVLGEFIEIDAIEQWVGKDEFPDEYLKFFPKDKLPGETKMTFHFEDKGAETHLTLTITSLTEEDKQKHLNMGAEGGWNSSFDKLEELLANLQAA
ncbi:MAG: SRPBCC domain-containing protein [Bacteroidota bacterium]